MMKERIIEAIEEGLFYLFMLGLLLAVILVPVLWVKIVLGAVLAGLVWACVVLVVIANR